MSIEHELARLFEAERAVQPPPSAQGAGWSRLALDLATSTKALPVAAGPLKMALGIVPKWCAGGFAIGLFGVGTAALVAPDAPPRLAPANVVIAASLTAPPVAPVPDAPLAIPAPAPSTAPAPSANRNTVAAPSTSATPSTFDAELALLKQAKTALDAGSIGAARASLARHAELFPTGVFATERDALAMIAECQAGPKNPTLGARFAALHPGSPLLQRVDRACAVRAPSANFPILPNGPGEPEERTSEPGEER